MTPLLRQHTPLIFGLAFSCWSCGCSTTPEARAPADAVPSLRPPPEEELLSAELTTVGWDEITRAPVALLREPNSGRVVPIWIGLAEARAISAALHDVELPRPMTHDLIVDLLGHLGAELEEVVVSDLVGGTYLGLLKLRVEGEDEPRWVDTRPSDGMALALRTGARLRVARKIVDELPDYDFLAPDGLEQVVRVLGLTAVAASDELRASLGLPERAGLVVTRAEGEAARRGLRAGDLIVEIEGEVPAEPLDLLEALRGLEAGALLHLTYWRGGEEIAVELDPTAPPPSPSARQVV